MKVTVYLSTYNQEQFVAQALDSILMQKTDFDYTYAEGPGVHNWAFWAEWVKTAIKWMLEGCN